MQRKRLLSRALSIPLIAFATTMPAFAEEAIEEIVVTGSYIKGTPEDAALPVDVITAQDLEDQGSPSIIEFVRNLGVTSGNLGETNQFQAGGQGNEGVSTINLRGLGASRTLVLINGRRHVSTETVGVDISALPVSALGRVEVLKDGAAALYGSDAIGGVVNMITRSGFEGFELRGSNQFIEDSDGDYQVAGIYGWANDRMNASIAAEYEHRGELQIRDRDWGLLDQPLNPAGGWSGIGNPGRFLPAAPSGAIIGAGGPDPQCTNLGGAIVGPACQFQYTYFDNLIEEQDTYKIFAEFNMNVGDNAEWHTEFMYADMDMPEWKTSPSYPPQSLFGADRFIAASHPGLIDFKAQNPTLFSGALVPVAAQGAYTLTRYLGVAGFFGKPQEGIRQTQTSRLATSLTGSLFNDELNYDVGVSYSTRRRHLEGYDMYVERMAFALDGLGGSGCDPSTGTPGVGGCEYYNPFSNAIERSAVNGNTNPQYNPAVANSADMINWLVGKQASSTTNELLVWDVVFSGETGIQLPGGGVGWAAGFQARNEKFDFWLNDLTNLAVNPCPFSNPMSVTLGNTTTLNCNAPTGPLAFLAGATEEKTSRTAYGLFAEFALPITDTIDAQFAVRFEDYGGEVGSTIDPKLAVRWQATDWLTARGSVSTTFRGPPQSYLSGRGTALQFIAAANAFKAVDTLGNPNLEPETATASNFGFVVDTGNFFGSIDYWRFDFEDQFQVESAQQIVAAYSAQNCADEAVPVANGPDCPGLRSHVFPLGVVPAGVERVEVNWTNGSDVVISGIDLFGQYDFADVMGGDLSLGLEASYTMEYDSDDFLDINGVTLAQGGDFVGYLNTGANPYTPKPEWKGNLFAKYAIGGSRFTYMLRYVDSYEDARTTTISRLQTIDDQVTHDVYYTLDLFDNSTLLSLSVINLTDEDPPGVQLDQNYDPFTHNAFGRMVKLGLKYTLGGG